MRLILTLPLLVALPLLGCSTKPSGGAPPAARSASASASAAPSPSVETPTSGILDMVSTAFLRRRSADGIWHNEVLAAPNPHGEMLRAIWSAGSDVYVTGYAYTGVEGPDDGVVYKRQTNGRWQQVFKVNLKELGGGWASGPSDVYASGVAVAHYDGKSWREIEVSPGKRTSYRISGSGPKDVLAFDLTGTVHRLGDDGTWSQEADLKVPINDGLVIDPDTAYAVGEEGAVFHRIKRTWKRESSGVRDQLTHLWASGPNDVYAAGSVLVHSKGDGVWTPVIVPRVSQPTQVTGRAANDVWALGLAGIAHYDGSRWEPFALEAIQPAGTKGMVSLNAVAVIAGEVFVAGDSTTSR